MKKTLLMLLVVGVGVNAGAQSSSPKFVPAKPIPVSHSRQETAPRMEPASFFMFREQTTRKVKRKKVDTALKPVDLFIAVQHITCTVY